MDDIQRVIERLQYGLRYGAHYPVGRLKKELQYAISAMQELQQYRELGLTLNQIRQIDKLYLEKCQEVNALKGQIVDAALEAIIKLSEGTEK